MNQTPKTTPEQFKAADKFLEVTGGNVATALRALATSVTAGGDAKTAVALLQLAQSL